MNLILEKHYANVDKLRSSTWFCGERPQFTTWRSVGPSSQDNSMGKIPRFHTSKLGKSLGRKVEQH
jgi:hypothetical protein